MFAALQNVKYYKGDPELLTLTLTLTLTQNDSNWSLQFPNAYSWLLKEDVMHQSGKHDPAPTFLKRVADIQF